MNPNEDNLYKIRHSAEHIFNQAIEELYPGKITRALGPAIDTGFYNDSRWEIEVTEEMFSEIEKKMKHIVKKNLPFVEQELSEQEARELFKANPFKQELIDEFVANGEKLTVYHTGNPEKEQSEFIDLCKGPHVKSTGEVKAFKLLSVAGAYWRGDEKNEMLTRVYGTAFGSREELDEYIKEVEERKQNDHRELNKVLDIFTQSDLVGKGLVMYTPNGTIVKNELRDHLMRICKKHGAQEVDIPHMAKIDLYEKSGHAEKFKEELFRVISHYDEEFVLKPVNCPHHTQIYASRPRSYRDLPISYVESTQQHRDEKPGAMAGLNRARSFEIDDGHTFCTPEQIKSEAINMLKIMEEFYQSLGMWGNHWVSLSFRDPNTPEKYIGDEKGWDIAQKMLKEINDELELDGKIMEGEAALYGPKIDIMLKDALGNDRQLGTVQIDFAMPQRFGLTYTDKDGTEKTPVMLHRAIVGSYHRFIANLMETTKGAFPLWLSPTQVQIIPISEKHIDYAKLIAEKLKNEDIRTSIDTNDETMGNKIRKAQNLKIPYMLILGDKEIEDQKISVRSRDGSQDNLIDLESFTQKIKNNIMSKSLN